MSDVLARVTLELGGVVHTPWVWLVVFLVAGLDALLPLMPSEATVILVAVLVTPMPTLLLLLVVVAAAGAMGGDWLGYLIGRLAAGTLGYPARRVLVVDAIATLVWAAYSTAIGFLGGTAFTERPVAGLMLAFTIGLALTVLIELGRRTWTFRLARTSGKATGRQE